MRKIRTNILTPIDQDTAILLKDNVLWLEDAKIVGIKPFDPQQDQNAEDRITELALPGFIDIHTHLSQYRIRGMYEPALLDWLTRYVFPEESRSADGDYAVALARDFFQAIFAQGTTTSVIYTAPFAESCRAAFEVARQTGARAFIGMTLMDQNSPAILQQTTEYALEQSIALFEEFDSQNPLLNYIFTPRFAISCTAALMRRVTCFAHDRDAWIQTHLSENRREIAEVLKLHSTDSYTHLYDSLGLLRPKSIFAHAIHLSEEEVDLLAANECNVAHCPDSNFFLKSGEFNYASLHAKGVQIGIGSDVAAGSSLNMLYHAKMANYRQSAYSLKPERLFYHVTLGNARLLGLGDSIGSLETGKEADLVFLPAPEIIPDVSALVSALCFGGHELPVRETIIAGRTVHRI